MLRIILLLSTVSVGIYVAYTMWELAEQTRKAWRDFCDWCEEDEKKSGRGF